MIKTLLFYIPIVIDIIGILVAVYFLIADAMRYAKTNRYSSSNNGPLLLVTVLMCGWVTLSFYLHHTQAGLWGTRLAWIPATPLLLYGVFILMFMMLKPNMK